MATVNIGIRLSEELLQSLEHEAEREGRSRSGQARYIIRQHLADDEPASANGAQDQNVGP